MPRPHAVNAFSSAAHINLIEWAIVSVEGAGGAGGGETSAQNMRIKMTRCLHSLLLSVALSSYNVREGEGRRKREQEGGDRGGQRERNSSRASSRPHPFADSNKKKNGPLKMFMTHAAGSPQKRWPAACGMWQSVWHMIN